MFPLRAGISTLMVQVAGRSPGQYPHASLHEYLFFLMLTLKKRKSTGLCLKLHLFVPFFFKTSEVEIKISRFDPFLILCPAPRALRLAPSANLPEILLGKIQVLDEVLIEVWPGRELNMLNRAGEFICHLPVPLG